MAIQLRELIIAIFLAIFLWYGITGSEKVESSVDVRLDYRGLPEGLVVTDGLVNKIKVRVRASGGLLRSMYDKDPVLVINLSSVSKGDNLVLVPVDDLVLSGGVEIMEVTPARLSLAVDALVEKTIPVVLHVARKISPDYLVQVAVEPSEVTVKGGSEVIATVEETVLDVVLEDPLQEGVTTKKRVLSVTGNIDVSPGSVNIVQTVEVKRKRVTVKLPVEMPENVVEGTVLTPDTVLVTVEAPVSLARPQRVAELLMAQVTKNLFGSKNIRTVTVDMPSSFKLISIEPDTVQVDKLSAE